jgi:flagellar biosynthetic protein FliP
MTAQDWRRAAGVALLATLSAVIWPNLALAQSLNVNLGSGSGLTDRVVQLVALMTVLSLAPSIVMMTTSFVRIVVVLSLLRTALGASSPPPNAVMVSLALFLTAIIMTPTFNASYAAGIKPLMERRMELPQAFARGLCPGQGVHAAPGRPGRSGPCSSSCRRSPARRTPWRRRCGGQRSGGQ